MVIDLKNVQFYMFWTFGCSNSMFLQGPGVTSGPEAEEAEAEVALETARGLM